MTHELIPSLRTLLIETVTTQITQLDQATGDDPRLSKDHRIEKFARKQRLETLQNLLQEHPSIILHKP